MGGQAFASRSPPLFTPRMPSRIYNQILNTVGIILRQHFNCVASSIEAPGKTTYGDVDFLVCEPLSIEFDRTRRLAGEVEKTLAKATNAKAWVCNKGNPTVNLALPWPSLPTEETVGEEFNNNEVEGKEKFVQVDVHICLDEKSFKWELFHAAHGDLWNILGTTIRPFGLTADNKGLYLRIPEIELLNRNRSKIFLTDEPSRVLRFLGLDEEWWWKSFDSMEDMFRYAATCRMFRVKKDVEGEFDRIEAGEGDVVGEIEGQEGGEKGKKKLKHNDRQRMSKRPIFKQWIDEFIPKCREEGKHFEPKVSREKIRSEAFDQFGVKDEYETRLHDFQLSRHTDEIWRVVLKGSVPLEDVDPQFRAAAIRTLKPVIFEAEPFDGEVVEASKRDNKGFYDVKVVKNFVETNWKRAGEIGWQRQEVKAREGMKTKEEKRRKAKEEKQRDEGGKGKRNDMTNRGPV